MSYQVIARKWRPQTFEEVTGQETITQTLRNALEHDRLHHAYLFSGARGVGKTTTARLLAKALNCHKSPKPNPFPCSFNDENACASCREISESRSIDVLEFDAASHTGVDDIRDIILESINISPARDRYKIFIIDEVHMLSNSSFNALLKTLEEPPPNVEFIMATTELHKVPDTILSRCQEFEFRTIAVKKIFERLKLIAETEKITVSDEALTEIARSGEGSMRDAQSNFDQVISFSGERIETEDVVVALGLAGAEMLTRIATAIAENQPQEALKVVDELISRGQDLRNFSRDLLAFFRDLLVFKMAGEVENLLDTAILTREEMRQYAAPFSESDLIRFFNSLSETETKLKDATQSRYVLEIGLVKLIEMRRVAPIEKILERLANLENALLGGNLPKIAPNTVNLPPPTQSSEKKTLKVDFPLSDVPFPVNSSANIESEVSNFVEETLIDEPITDNFPQVEHIQDVETLPENNISSEEILQNSEFESEPPSFMAVEPEYFPDLPDFPETETKPQLPPSLREMIAAMPVKMLPITAEELEHFEDTKLDDAYDNRLVQLDDNLFPIKNASQIVEKLLNFAELPAFSANAENSSGNGSATAPAREKIAFHIPQLDEEPEETGELPVLSENPTQEELLAYAHAHPLVKKAIKLFRGKIIEISKGGTPA